MHEILLFSCIIRGEDYKNDEKKKILVITSFK